MSSQLIAELVESYPEKKWSMWSSYAWPDLELYEQISSYDNMTAVIATLWAL